MNRPLDVAERAICAVCADALATFTAWAVLAWASVALALVANLRTDFAPHAAVALVAVLCLAVVERALAVRVALDARLFARLADGSVPGLAELDAGLQQVFKLHPSKAGRPLAPRLHGARRLYRLHLACAAAMALVAAIAWV